jgi:hypothetical protein
MTDLGCIGCIYVIKCDDAWRLVIVRGRVMLNCCRLVERRLIAFPTEEIRNLIC